LELNIQNEMGLRVVQLNRFKEGETHKQGNVSEC
jgi:hypothetical protein